MDFKDLGLEYRIVRLQSVAVFCKVLCSEDKSTTVGVIFPFGNEIFSSSGNGYSEGLIQGHLCVNMYWVPIPDMTASTVGGALIKSWISRFNIPLRISTDQGRLFESLLFNKLYRILGVEYLRTSQYHREISSNTKSVVDGKRRPELSEQATNHTTQP